MRAPKKPQPEPATITFDRVRDHLLVFSEDEGPFGPKWAAVHEVIDLMNGWDGKWASPTLGKARRKLQQAKGSSTHEHPTSAQASATRGHLEALVKLGLAEMRRGGGRSNNSFSYRWITQAMRDRTEARSKAGERAKETARRLSLAFGYDGESGVKALFNPDSSISFQVTVREGVALDFLAERAKIAEWADAKVEYETDPAVPVGRYGAAGKVLLEEVSHRTTTGLPVALPVVDLGKECPTCHQTFGCFCDG